ncbi:MULTISPECIES: HlyD family type I secretion periplasmic adaptor subunit [unclassified Brenneria]|uniref:HlyD family type I secretion periplasmic adaptor subunit n=1 Tax=unclassified Brenneria TaxID=2634434 RepID=UPI00155770ED|nr:MULTISPECIES: HlyD family type I secretion periplasmic adaptor subunit [unclassified Brenneria]MBJ7224168.1 HlyD family type I secretion periplasmic adaptor subunit [Brenneria sp. L3-3C-1]MEE3645413.1 HlyD family type I secretion periplasmic adaptor subunit [Brenneria sp. L3_3C_1]MEE3652712.1 HlyD family type I secretion periplasmic adaptor subunit [Brenneria sp. HEZEL_4_2_4]NPD02670.1 HlyD family type I secretion periplasmic adaptor subunit [Brenneria sp. hezel4-2-4]
MKINPLKPIDDDLENENDRKSQYVGAERIIVITALLLLATGIWAVFGSLDEVSTGIGKVIPSSREQTLQSLDGGILSALTVREGALVESGQVVARLDPTRSESNMGESAARYRASLAASIRLNAEVNDQPLEFPDSIKDWPELTAAETRLYKSRRTQLADSESRLKEALVLVESELTITERLVKTGAASHVEVLRLRRQKADLDLKLTDLHSQYYVQARQELAKANAEVDMLSEVIKGRADSVTRMTVRSPVRGIVKNIQVTTIGGVIAPNGDLMEIVPVDDHLLVEARLSPRDIAFIHPGQKALVKITAYDYAIYGGLDGVVETISPDTIQDEAKPEIFYYRVFIRTDQDYLQNKAGRRFSIVPGMIASVDIKTGEKTVMDYLIKPFNRMNEALRER